MIGAVLHWIQFDLGKGLLITSNMLCGYCIMILCFIQLLMTMIFFDNKNQIKLSTRNTFTRTLTIQPRKNSNLTYSTPKYTMSANPLPLLTNPGAPKFNSDKDKSFRSKSHSLLLNNHQKRNNNNYYKFHSENFKIEIKEHELNDYQSGFIGDNITPPPPPPKLINNNSYNKNVLYKIKQKRKLINNYKTYDDQVLNFSDASPVSLSQRSLKSNKSRNWLDSASPPSTLPCIPDDNDINNGYPYPQMIIIDDDNEDDDDGLNQENENPNHNQQNRKKNNNKLKEKINGMKVSASTPNLNGNGKVRLIQTKSDETGISVTTTTTKSECKEKEKDIYQQQQYRKMTHTGSYRSFSFSNTFHRTSVAEMLNIDTPSAVCTPYTPYNVLPTPFTPQTPQTPYDDINYNKFDDNNPHHHYNENVNVTIGNTINTKNGNITTRTTRTTTTTTTYIKTYATWNKFASIIMTFCFLIHFEAFSIQQTMTSYLIKRKFDWKVQFANYLFILCGIIWMASFYIINKLLLLPKINRVGLVKLSLFMGVIATFCLISITFPNIKYNEYLYLFGFILISFTFPFGRGAVISLYCLCTNYEYIEWIYLVSMISRIITPYIGIGLYFTNKASSWTYGNICILFMIAIILCSFTISSLKKQKTKRNRLNIINHGYSIINIPQVFYHVLN